MGQDLDDPSSTSTGLSLPDYADWRSDSPPTDVVDLTEQEKVAIRDTRLQRSRARLESEYGIDAPTVALVRWTGRDEYATMLVKCLTAEGFPMRLVGVSGVAPVNPIPASQTAALELARFKCRARYTLDPTYGQPLTEQQQGVVYDYFVTWLTPCLTGLGFEIDDPPSRETYISKHKWDPYRSLFATGRFSEDSDDGEKVVAACPRQPPVAALYP